MQRGNTVSPVEGKYELTEGTEYTYTAEADGYIRISGKVDMNADGPIVRSPGKGTIFEEPAVVRWQWKYDDSVT